jgi:protein-S-isoprenylcysteine O-methyltransferase Ste14
MSLELTVTVRMVLMLIGWVGILFLPAGTWRFWQAWAYLAAMFFPVLWGFTYLLRHDRPLVERRMRNRESISEQKLLMRVFILLALGSFLLPGFDYRLGWTRRWVGEVPVWLTVLALLMVVAGFLFVFSVMKTNSYAGRTITVDAGQQVISTGPYAVVRHPMYLGSLLLLLSAPLALGSWVALPAFALTIPIFVMRLLNEEKVLRVELAGYADYCAKTRYHLIPFVW